MKSSKSAPETGQPPAALLLLVGAPLLLGLGLITSGIGSTVLAAGPAVQPIAFSHSHHLDYFTEGEHRKSMIGMHLEALDLEEDAPAEMFACNLCHEPDEGGLNQQCMSCHDVLGNSKLRAREDIRACVVCHQGAWDGSAAYIPSIQACAICHDGGFEPFEAALADGYRPDEGQKLREYLERGEDLPWMRLNTSPDHVYFSHSSHVRHAGMACVDCHGDMSGPGNDGATVTDFSMDTCVECHAENDAGTDCLTCHQ